MLSGSIPISLLLSLLFFGQDAAAAASLTALQQERFLLRGQVIAKRPTSKGVTGVLRVTLRDGDLIHDAAFQTVDIARNEFKAGNSSEINFRDTWQATVAASRLARLLNLENVPISVERRIEGKSGALTWWVEDVVMDEEDRNKKEIRPPDLVDWTRQVQTMRIFDQLIYNVDRNLTNMLIDKGWRLWLIDHSRAFRLYTTLRDETKIARCSRDLLVRIKALTSESLGAACKPYLNDTEIRAVLARRDRIVQLMEEKGDSALW